MTTNIVNAPGDSSTDAGLRLWGKAFHDLLSGAGLIQMADTGQVDWTTVVKVTGTLAPIGYSLWRFNDSLQATAPIVIRFDFVTSQSSTDASAIHLTVGTGSNGAGAITGTSSIKQPAGGQYSTSSVAAVDSYACHVEGYLGVAYRPSTGYSNGAGTGSFIVCRTCDAAGTPNGIGATIIRAPFSTSGDYPSVSALRFLTPTRVIVDNVSSAYMMLSPFQLMDAIDGLPAVMLTFTAMPEIQPLFACPHVDAMVVADKSTFQATLVGTSLRTFINIRNSNYRVEVSSSKQRSIPLLWE